MKHKKKHNNSLLARISTGVFTSANFLSIGLLSFSGSFLISPSLLRAALALFFASSVELTVNKQNISDAIQKIADKDYLFRLLVRNLLNDLCKKYKGEIEREEAFHFFLREYSLWSKRYADLNSIHSHEQQHQEDLEEAENHLKKMELFFGNYIKSTVVDQNDLNDGIKSDIKYSAFSTYITSPENFMANYESKRRMIRGSWLVSGIAGIGNGFITAYSAHAGLMTLLAYFGASATGTILASTIIPLAIMAGAAYMLIIYNTFHKMIADESLIKKWRETRDYFSHLDRKHLLLDLLKKFCFGVVVVGIVLLGIFVTFAMGKTWLTGIQQAASFVPYLKDFASHFSSAVVVFVAAAAAIFTLENSLQSVWEIKKLLIKFKQFILGYQLDLLPDGETIKPGRIYLTAGKDGSLTYQLITSSGKEIENSVTGKRLKAALGDNFQSFKTALAANDLENLKKFTKNILALTTEDGHIPKSYYQELIELQKKETVLEFVNPFRFMAYALQTPIKLAIFLCHVISVGDGTDNCKPIPPKVAEICGALNDGSEDAGYLFDFGDNHQCAHGHDHRFIDQVVHAILAPVFLLDGIWRWVFSAKSASDCFRKAFDIHEIHHQLVPLAKLEKTDWDLGLFSTTKKREGKNPSVMKKSVSHYVGPLLGAHV